MLPDHPDLVGLCLLPVAAVLPVARAALARVRRRVRRDHGLEIVGTQFGNWRWADTVPGIGLSQGNPPSAIAAGYCLLDAIVLFLSSRVWLARIPLGGRRAPARAGHRGAPASHSGSAAT